MEFTTRHKELVPGQIEMICSCPEIIKGREIRTYHPSCGFDSRPLRMVSGYSKMINRRLEMTYGHGGLVTY